MGYKKNMQSGKKISKFILTAAQKFDIIKKIK